MGKSHPVPIAFPESFINLYFFHKLWYLKSFQFVSMLNIFAINSHLHSFRHEPFVTFLKLSPRNYCFHLWTLWHLNNLQSGLFLFFFLFFFNSVADLFQLVYFSFCLHGGSVLHTLIHIICYLPSPVQLISVQAIHQTAWHQCH